MHMKVSLLDWRQGPFSGFLIKICWLEHKVPYAYESLPGRLQARPLVRFCDEDLFVIT